LAGEEDYVIFPIPWRKALEGCKLSIENAKRLAEDARLLKQNIRPQSALWVALAAWEELGKAVLLLRYYKQKENISKKDWFGVLRDHKSKRVAYVHSMDVLYGSSPPKSVKQLKHDLEKFTEDKGWRDWFSLEREIGVHVDWVESIHHGKHSAAHWQSPCKIGKEWFSLLPLDSEYWRRAVTANCKHLESILLTLPNRDS
jgi:AbiV family abortive infection protein